MIVAILIIDTNSIIILFASQLLIFITIVIDFNNILNRCLKLYSCCYCNLLGINNLFAINNINNLLCGIIINNINNLLCGIIIININNRIIDNNLLVNIINNRIIDNNLLVNIIINCLINNNLLINNINNRLIGNNLLINIIHHHIKNLCAFINKMIIGVIIIIDLLVAFMNKGLLNNNLVGFYE
jgi:hypothetical protein